MKIDYLVIVQARMGSSRFPGKSLVELKGTPMIGHVLEGLSSVCEKDRIRVVTTSSEDDEPLVGFCKEAGYAVMRGSVEDVASRYFNALEEAPECTHFFRICGDTPIYDPGLIPLGLHLLAEGESGKEIEIVSSMPVRGYPMGQNLELLDSSVFKHNYPMFSTKGHREHVTTYFYENWDRYVHREVTCDIPGYSYEKYKFSIDTIEDLNRIQRLFDLMERPQYTYSFSEKCELYELAVESIGECQRSK